MALNAINFLNLFMSSAVMSEKPPLKLTKYNRKLLSQIVSFAHIFK